MAWETVSSRTTEKGHWQVTIQDTNGIIVDGVDTGPTYTDLVAEGEPWSLLEANLVLAREWVRYVYASAVLELLRRLVVGQEPGGKLYPLTQRTLECLGEAPAAAVPHVFRAFEIKAATFLGHGPQLFCCVGCGRQVESGVGFDPLRGGLVCGACAVEEGEAQRLSGAVLGTLRRWLRSPLADLYQETADRSVFRTASALLDRFMKTHWDKYDLRTLRAGFTH